MNLFDDPEEFDIEAEYEWINYILSQPPILSKDMAKIGDAFLKGFADGMEMDVDKKIMNDMKSKEVKCNSKQYPWKRRKRR